MTCSGMSKQTKQWDVSRKLLRKVSIFPKESKRKCGLTYSPGHCCSTHNIHSHLATIRGEPTREHGNGRSLKQWCDGAAKLMFPMWGLLAFEQNNSLLWPSAANTLKPLTSMAAILILPLAAPGIVTIKKSIPLFPNTPVWVVIWPLLHWEPWHHVRLKKKKCHLMI